MDQIIHILTSTQVKIGHHSPFGLALLNRISVIFLNKHLHVKPVIGDNLLPISVCKQYQTWGDRLQQKTIYLLCSL